MNPHKIIFMALGSLAICRYKPLGSKDAFITFFLCIRVTILSLESRQSLSSTVLLVNKSFHQTPLNHNSWWLSMNPPKACFRLYLLCFSFDSAPPLVIAHLLCSLTISIPYHPSILDILLCNGVMLLGSGELDKPAVTKHGCEPVLIRGEGRR